MEEELKEELRRFYTTFKFNSKGKLSVALVVTQHARRLGLPLDPDTLLTEQGGQVLGLGRQAVQNILGRYNIDRVLAQEGGRTSRGSISAMKEYTSFLNSLHSREIDDIGSIEKFWIEKVGEFFSSKPFKIKMDGSQSLRNLVKDLLLQALSKQKESQGVYYMGAVMQHLVGAKLDCALGKGFLNHNSFSTSDLQSGRKGDFLVGDTAIHVTTTPTEAVILRCKENLEGGLRPMIITTERGQGLAQGLAENVQLNHRIDIFEIEQFIALNVYESARFDGSGRCLAVNEIAARYNEIVGEYETDPSMRIEIM